jgi:hypothetical protein
MPIPISGPGFIFYGTAFPYLDGLPEHTLHHAPRGSPDTDDVSLTPILKGIAEKICINGRKTDLHFAQQNFYPALALIKFFLQLRHLAIRLPLKSFCVPLYPHFAHIGNLKK